MKKDIHIPEVKDVYIAVVHDYNENYKVYDWNAYIINDKAVDLEMVIIVTKGYFDAKKTATFRKKIELLPAKCFAKIELLLDDILAINNRFDVSFFENNTVFEKSFEFSKNTINEKALQNIPLMNVKGVLKS